eukprot:UN06080
MSFKEYYPKPFQRLRKIVNLENKDFAKSLDGEWCLFDGTGKSGAQVVQLNPGKENMFVKTIYENEIRVLQQLT